MLCASVFAAMPQAHMLFVDDNSQDGTQLLIEKQMQNRPKQIFILRRERKLGLGTAYIAGFKWGLDRHYQSLIEMDADLSHNPSDLPRLLAGLQEADAVLGSRYVPGGGTQNWGLLRKMISTWGSFYARTILGIKVRDLTGGFNFWSRKVLEALDLDDIRSEGYAFQIELKYRAIKKGFKLLELPIVFVDRRAGSSKMSASIFVEAMFRVWALRGITKTKSLTGKRAGETNGPT